MKEIFNRRSVRNFLPIPVEQEKVEKLLRAGMQAPSARKQLPWEFLVIQNDEMIEKLSHATQFSNPIKTAKLAIIVLGNKDKLTSPASLPLDLSAATQNILLEAVHLDLGGLWVGVYGKDDVMANISNWFNLPENIVPFALLGFGYPNGPGNVFVDRFDDKNVHYEKY